MIIFIFSLDIFNSENVKDVIVRTLKMMQTSIATLLLLNSRILVTYRQISYEQSISMLVGDDNKFNIRARAISLILVDELKLAIKQMFMFFLAEMFPISIFTSFILR